MKLCWLHQEYVLICCIRQYAYWIDPDMLEYLQPVWRMFHTRQHSAWMDADICVYNWWRYLCHHYHSATCLFVLEISHHALCSLVWFSCKWVVIMFCYCVFTARSELHKVLFLVLSVTFFVCSCMKYLWNHWTDVHQIHMADVFGPSLGWIWMSRSQGTNFLPIENAL